MKHTGYFLFQDLSLVGPNYENLFKTAGPTMFNTKDYRMGTGIGESMLHLCSYMQTKKKKIDLINDYYWNKLHTLNSI